MNFMGASAVVAVYALVLLDRLQEYHPGFYIRQNNLHRLLLVSNVVAAKYLEDLYYSNSFYAKIGGISLD
jgi:hypothetical protein